MSEPAEVIRGQVEYVLSWDDHGGPSQAQLDSFKDMTLEALAALEKERDFEAKDERDTVEKLARYRKALERHHTAMLVDDSTCLFCRAAPPPTDDPPEDEGTHMPWEGD